MRNTIVGTAMIAVAALIYTVERGFAYWEWLSLRSAVVISGSGSYPATPDFPGFADNVFVPVLLVAGVGILVLNIVAHTRIADRSMPASQAPVRNEGLVP